jgi:hypothetical protein
MDIFMISSLASALITGATLNMKLFAAGCKNCHGAGAALSGTAGIGSR